MEYGSEHRQVQVLVWSLDDIVLNISTPSAHVVHLHTSNLRNGVTKECTLRVLYVWY